MLLPGLELLDAGLELLDLLPQACEIARHRLQQLRRVGRWGGGGRRDGFRCGLSRGCRLRRCCIRRVRLNGRRGRLRGERRFFGRRRYSQDELRRQFGDLLFGHIAVGFPGDGSKTDARRQQQRNEGAHRPPGH